MSILGQARKRLEDSGVLSSSQRTLPELYGVDNYASLPGVQAHAQLARQAGHVAPFDYAGEPVQPTTPEACAGSGGTWDATAGVCILPGQTVEEAVVETQAASSDRDRDRGIMRDVATADSEFRSGLVPQSQWEADLQLQIAKALAGTNVGQALDAFGVGIPTTHTGLARQQAESNRAWNQDVIRAQADDYTQRAADTGTTVHEIVQRDRDRDRDPGPSGAERAARAAAASRSDSASNLGGANLGYSGTGSREVGREYDPRHNADGGIVYAENGANLSEHPGEPRGTDKVPAWLTEGEYIADKDSTEIFEPVLKAINDWEPGMPMDNVLRAMDDFIKMSNDKEMGEAVYKQFGGVINNLLQAAGPQQTPSLGRDLRNRALQARNAQVRGALLQGGLGAQGRAQANQAGLITQAGQQNQTFTPQAGALDALGQGLAGREQAEAQYQGDLANISRQEYEDQVAAEKSQYDRDRQQQLDFEKKAEPIRKELKAIEDGNRALEETAKEARVMADYVTQSGPAWAIFVDYSGADNLAGIDNTYAKLWSGIATGNETIQLDYLKQKGLKAVQGSVGRTITQAQSNAVSNTLSALDNLATAALKAQGPGVKTNFDFQVARQTITTLNSAAPQVVAGIQAFIERINRQIEANNQIIQDKTAEMDGLASGYGFEPAGT